MHTLARVINLRTRLELNLLSLTPRIKFSDCEVKSVNKKKIVISIASLICVALFPGFFLYLQNTGVAILSDLFKVSGILLLISLIILCFSFLVFGHINVIHIKA